jgi:hypothetical protein
MAAIAFSATVIVLSAAAAVTAAAANPSAKGSAPNSALCQTLRPLSRALSSDSARASKARNWAQERSDYLAGLQVQAQEYAALQTNAHGVPKSVTSAVPKALKTAKALAVDLRDSKTHAQFTSPASAVVVITYNAGQSKLLQYFAQQCGGESGSSGASSGNPASGH